MRVIATYRGELPEEWMLHSLFIFLLENQMFGHQRSAHKCSFLPPRLPKDRPNSEGEKKEKKKKTLVPLRLQSVLPFSRDCNRSPPLFMFIYRSFARILSCSQMRGETRLWSHAVNYSITRQHPALAVQGWKNRGKKNTHITLFDWTRVAITLHGQFPFPGSLRNGLNRIKKKIIHLKRLPECLLLLILDLRLYLGWGSGDVAGWWWGWGMDRCSLLF